MNLQPWEFSQRRMIRVVWSRSWCFGKSLNYRLARRKRWSWMLCSKMSSRRVCEESPSKGKSGTSKRAVHSSRHPSGGTINYMSSASSLTVWNFFLSMTIYKYDATREESTYQPCASTMPEMPESNGCILSSSDTDLILAEIKGLTNSSCSS